MICDAGERVGEPCLRIDAIEFGGLDQGNGIRLRLIQVGPLDGNLQFFDLKVLL